MTHPGPVGALPALDPRLLGRPVHLVPRFAARARERLQSCLDHLMNRRYRAGFELTDVVAACPGPEDAPAKWHRVRTPVGDIGVAIERPLVLAALHYRFGTAPAPDAPETATEERLAARLATDFAAALAGAVDAAPHAMVDPAACRTDDGPAPAPATSWTVRALVVESTLAALGQAWFTLDDAVAERLLANLQPARARGRTLASAAAEPLSSRLQLALTARLASREIALGELMDARPGDVIPIRLGSAEVLIDDAPLFRAAVAEQAGKLCLTSFENLD